MCVCLQFRLIVITYQILMEFKKNSTAVDAANGLNTISVIFLTPISVLDPEIGVSIR